MSPRAPPSGRLAVWDVDGTLVDSRASIQAAMVRAYEAEGLDAPGYDLTRAIVGLSLREAMGVLSPELEPLTLDRLTEGYKAAWVQLHADPAFHEPLYPGAADLLEAMAQAGWGMAMATGKSRRGVESVLAAHGWSGVFVSTHCADDGPGKPHPAMLQAALAASGAAPGEAVMIGDTAFDMRMARAAGVRAQGVSWGFHTADEVREGGAHAVAHSFAELHALLDRWAAGPLEETAPA